MSTISWNCCGLGNPRTVQELVDIVSTKRPKFVFLMEVKTGRQQIERVRRLLNYERCFIVDSVRGGGGIMLLWKEKQWPSLISFSRNHIDVRVNIPEMAIWRLTGFYGYPERARRSASWDMLRSICSRSSLPWCCIGDFNDLLTQSEKKGRLRHPNSLIQGFRKMVEQCGLRDLGMEGYPFTWEKSRGTQNWVEERLDRAMANQEWSILFNTAYVFNLETPTSDHSALFLDFMERPRIRRRRFRFENAWLKEAECKGIVVSSWERSVNGHIQEKIKQCSGDLQIWGEKVRLKFKEKISSCRKRIKSLKFRRDEVSLQQFKDANNELGCLLNQQEAYWRQRAKQFWLNAGDSNTKFFHQFASHRRRKNSFEQLKNEQE